MKSSPSAVATYAGQDQGGHRLPGQFEQNGLKTQEGLIGFDWGRLSQEKRVEKPASSRKRSLENTTANAKRSHFALAA
jgi:hypothetical protein